MVFSLEIVCSKILFNLLFPSLSEDSLPPPHTILFKAVCLAYNTHLLWEWAVLGSDLKLRINPKLELYGHQQSSKCCWILLS